MTVNLAEMGKKTASPCVSDVYRGQGGVCACGGLKGSVPSRLIVHIDIKSLAGNVPEILPKCRGETYISSIFT